MGFLGKINKLQHRIVLSVVLGLSVVMLIFGYAATATLGQAIDAAFQARVALAHTVADDLDGKIEHAMRMLESTVELPSFSANSGDIASKRAVIEAMHHRLGSFAVITLLDSNGALLASVPEQPALAGNNLLFHPGARGALATGGRFLAELPPSSEDDVAMACLAVPIRGEAGAISGLLMAELDPRVPGLLTLAPSNDDVTRVELLDRSGAVVMSSGVRGSNGRAEHLPLLAGPIGEGRVDAVVHAAPAGSSHIVAYAPLRAFPEWGVSVEQPAYSVLALPGELAARMVVFGAIALFAAVVVAWLDVRRVVEPLRNLAAAAARIGAGDLETPVHMQRGYEVSGLALTIEGMRQGLQDSIGKRERYEAELERRVQQRTEEVVALLAASRAFASTLDLSELLQIVMRESRRACPGAEAGMLLVFQPKLGGLVPVASFGCEPGHAFEVCLKPGEGVAGRVFETRAAALLADEALEREDHTISPDNARHIADACPRIKQARGALSVPLIGKHTPVGSLILYEFHNPPTMSEAELEVLQALASHAAVAVENARLYEEVQEKDALRGQLLAKVISAQEEERCRMARELHDEPAQALTALTMAVDAALTGVEAVPAAQRERLVQAKALTLRALGDVRRMIWDLRPTILDDLGLLSAIRWYAEQRLETEDVRVRISTVGLRERLPAQVETEMYRILQEAIANIAKHARATRASIRLRYVGGILTAVVDDDGRGFDVEKVSAANGGGLGLLGMRERASLLGGSLAIRSTVGKGTRLTINVPAPNGGQ